MPAADASPSLQQAIGAAVGATGGVALIVADGRGRVLFANPCALRVLSGGAELPGGTHLRELVVTEDHVGLARLLDGHDSPPPTILRAQDDGAARVRALLVTADTMGWPGGPPGGARLLMGRDVGADLVREARMQRAEGFQIVGQLASGVAHELNNALSTVTTFTDLVLADTPGGSQAAEDLREVKQAALDAAAIIRKLDLFAGVYSKGASEVDLPTLVRALDKLLRRFLTRGVSVTASLDPSTPPVWAEPVRLEEVVLALAADAREALNGAGSFHVSVRPGAPDRLGRPVAVLELTYSVGGPPGPGRAGVRRIVEDLGGTLVLDAEPERGTVARVELPGLPASADTDPEVVP